MMKNQTASRLNHGEQDHGVNRPGGHDISPRFARVTEVDLAQLATEQSLRALHGIYIAGAAGAAVGAEQLRSSVRPPAAQTADDYLHYITSDPQTDTLAHLDFETPQVSANAADSIDHLDFEPSVAPVAPVSPEVLSYAAAPSDAIPPPPEAQTYASQVAPQPVQAPVSISAQQGF